jgi:hypothetical protein
MTLKTMQRLVPFLLVLACTACGPALVTSEPVTSAPPGSTPGVVVATSPGATALPDSDTPLAALVNGQPIYLADYERALGQYEADLPLRGIDPASAEGQADLARARSWILDFMVTEELIVQAAEKAGVAVSDEEVDAVMAEMVTENGGEEAFQAKLAEWGETYDIHWEKERRGLIVMQMSQPIVCRRWPSMSTPGISWWTHRRRRIVSTTSLIAAPILPR